MPKRPRSRRGAAAHEGGVVPHRVARFRIRWRAGAAVIPARREETRRQRTGESAGEGTRPEHESSIRQARGRSDGGTEGGKVGGGDRALCESREAEPEVR